MKPASSNGRNFNSDINVSAIEHDQNIDPVIQNVARLALTTPDGFVSTNSVSFSAFHDRFAKLHIKLRFLVPILILACLITIGIIYRSYIVSNVYRLYTNTYDKIALKINPLPPLQAGDIRIPTVNAKNVEHSIDNQTLGITIGSALLHPSATEIHSWYKVSPSVYGKTTVYVNKNLITTYLDQQINKFKVAPVNQVTVSLNDGYTTTLSNGLNGVTFPSSSAISSQIGNSLLSGKGINVSLASITIPHSVTTQTSIPKLIEVDVTAKKLYAYQNGTLINTFLVSAGAPATPTPTGNFAIWDKTPNQTMTGYNPNGTKYVQPNVPWVNYFDHNGDAVHGNYWRPTSYFGNINSSHGCVGLLNNDAEWIYNWAPIGTPVVIHS